MERGPELEAALFRNLRGALLGLVEIPPVLDELGAERAHGGVLLGRIAVRHHDRDRHVFLRAREGERLAMVAARRGDHALHVRALAREPVEIHEPAAHLEGADRGVVLVLDHDIHARACPQQRPGILRRRRHGGAHDGQDGFEFGKTEHRKEDQGHDREWRIHEPQACSENICSRKPRLQV